MKTSAIMVDLDGTVALRDEGPDGTTRDHYPGPQGEGRVLEDAPNVPIIALVNTLRHAGYHIIFMSGRTRACEKDTRRWLSMYLPTLTDYDLHMRAIGDTRRDEVIKEELYRQYVEPGYIVRYVLDDRNRVVEMWRRIGLTCLQVAEGNF